MAESISPSHATTKTLSMESKPSVGTINSLFLESKSSDGTTKSHSHLGPIKPLSLGSRSYSLTSVQNQQNIKGAQPVSYHRLVKRRQSLPPLDKKPSMIHVLRSSKSEILHHGDQDVRVSTSAHRFDPPDFLSFNEEMSPTVELAYKNLLAYKEPLLKERPLRSLWTISYYDSFPGKKLFSEKDLDMRANEREKIRRYLEREEEKRKRELKEMEEEEDEEDEEELTETLTAATTRKLAFQQQMEKYEFSEKDKAAIGISAHHITETTEKFVTEQEKRTKIHFRYDENHNLGAMKTHGSSFITDDIPGKNKTKQLPKSAEYTMRNMMRAQPLFLRQRSKSFDSKILSNSLKR